MVIGFGRPEMVFAGHGAGFSLLGVGIALADMTIGLY